MTVVALARQRTEEHDRPRHGWSLDEIAATLINEAPAEAISRTTVWRILHEADLHPHKSVYWLNSHDPTFDARAQAICQLYVQAPQLYQQGRWLICCDERTGMQVLRRTAPTQPPQPGKPEKREFEYVRLGTRTLQTSFVVATGEVVWGGRTHGSTFAPMCCVWPSIGPTPNASTGSWTIWRRTAAWSCAR